MSMLLDLRRHFPLSWKMVRRCRMPSGEMGEPYYVSFQPGGGVFGEQWNSFDADGVLYKNAYNPVSIAQYALYCYDRFKSGDADSRPRFLTQARYLRDSQSPGGTYIYGFGHPPYGLGAGWVSCLAQGEAASVLFRAFALTNDADYLDAAMCALRPYMHDVREGGVSFIRGNDVFFEEVAGCPVHILNGHICAAFALWEAERYGYASSDLRDLHATAIDTLLRWLPLYDADGWSYYQLALRNGKRHYAPITYHQTHINFLRVYAAMTRQQEFERMSTHWRRGLDRIGVRARVWADSAAWLGDALVARLSREATQPWEPMSASARA